MAEKKGYDYLPLHQPPAYEQVPKEVHIHMRRQQQQRQGGLVFLAFLLGCVSMMLFTTSFQNFSWSDLLSHCDWMFQVIPPLPLPLPPLTPLLLSKGDLLIFFFFKPREKERKKKEKKRKKERTKISRKA